VSNENKYVVKVYLFRVANVHKNPNTGFTLTQTDVANNVNGRSEIECTFEYERLVLCEHPHILKCFGKTECDDKSWLLLLEHAENGDLESFYKKIGFKGANDRGESDILAASTRVEMVW